MNIKYISLLSLLIAPAAQAILPDEIVDKAAGRNHAAYKALRKCEENRQESFFGRLCSCTKEEAEFKARNDEFKIVMSNAKKLLEKTVQEGNEAWFINRPKKLKAAFAQKKLDMIKDQEQQTNNPGSGHYLTRELAALPQEWILPHPLKEKIFQELNCDLYRTYPEAYDYNFIHDYHQAYNPQ